MKKIFTFCLYLIFVFSLKAQMLNTSADSSYQSGSKEKSCLGNPEHDDFKRHNKKTSLIKINGIKPIKWIERSNLLEFIDDRYFFNEKPIVQFIGNTSIDDKDIINYNVIIFDGTLTVNRKIAGSIAGVNSKIIIKNGSDISGSIILFNSTVKTDSSFNIEKVICGELTDYERSVIPFYSSYKFKNPKFTYFREEFPGQGLIRYNRVEGLYLGISSEKKNHWNGRKNYSYSGSFGYGFGNHRWSGAVGYDRWFGNDNRIEIGGETHSVTDSKDNWRIDNAENSLSSFFIHEDYKDYFLKEGWSFHLSKYFDRTIVINLEYVQDNYRNQKLNTDWALFGGDKRFRYNPSVKEGILRSIILAANYGTTNQKDYMPDGWDASVNYEIASGVSSFNRLLLDIRKYYLFENDNHISIRVMAGSADHSLPWQKSFEIGGLGTIPATSYKALSGNRMLLANIDYSIPLFEVFADFFNWEYYSNTGLGNLILSYDAGYADESASTNPFQGFNINKNSTRQDLGIALGFNRNKFRIGAAFRIDKSEPAQFVFRISRPF